MTPSYMHAVMTALVALMWTPALVWAGSITLDKTLDGLSATVMAVVLVLSTLAGFTALLQRIKGELLASGGRSLPLPWLFAGAHMTGSWLAGLLCFLLCEAGDVNDWLELALIILSSYLGARFVEMAAEWAAAKYLPGARPPAEVKP